MSTNNKISTIVSSQLPDFVRSDHPIFVSFLEAYYEYLEQSNTTLRFGKTVERAKNLRNYFDIDKIDEQNLTEFSQKLYDQFLTFIPKEAPADRSKILKNIKNFYLSGGTQKSYDFIYRILFGEESTIYYPKDEILRASAGKWYIEKSVRLIDTKVNGISDDTIESLKKFNSTLIRGNTSTATAQVEKILTTYENGVRYTELFLSKQKGTFIPGESFFTVNINGDTLSGNLLSGFISTITINDGGTAYTTGTPLVFEGGSGGSGAAGFISNVSLGNVSGTIVLSGGAGFKGSSNGSGPSFPADSVLYAGPVGSGAQGYVDIIDGTAQFHPLYYRLCTDVITTHSSTIIGAYSNSSTGNANTPLSNTWAYTNYGPIGPAVSVEINVGGSGYTIAPSASILGNTTLRNLNIPGRLTINSGGSGYANGDSIVLRNKTGSYGFGANANVTVNSSGAIVGYSWRRGVDDSLITPDSLGARTVHAGGSAYNQLVPPEVIIVSSGGAGANISLNAFLGFGEQLSTLTGSIGQILEVTLTNKGYGYFTPPSINLAGFGDGTANLTALVSSGTYEYPGRYLDDSGLISGTNKLENRDYYQNYSYVVKVGKALDKYRRYVSELIHPAGTRLWAEFAYKANTDMNNVIFVANTVKSNYFGYSANAYYFIDFGSYIYKDGALENTSSGNTGTLSFWFNPDKDSMTKDQKIFTITKSDNVSRYSTITDSYFKSGITRTDSAYATASGFYARYDGKRYYISTTSLSYKLVQTAELTDANAWVLTNSRFSSTSGISSANSPYTHPVGDISFSNAGDIVFTILQSNGNTDAFPYGGNIVATALSTNWNICTQTSNTRYSLSSAVGETQNNWSSLFITNDGTRLFATCEKRLYSFTFATPYDVTTLSYDSKSLDLTSTFPGAMNLNSDLATLYSNVNGISFANSGYYFVVAGTNEKLDYTSFLTNNIRGKIAVYNLTTPFDITTALENTSSSNITNINNINETSTAYIGITGLYIKQHSSNLNIDSTNTSLDMYISRGGLGVGQQFGTIIQSNLNILTAITSNANSEFLSVVLTSDQSNNLIKISGKKTIAGNIVLDMTTNVGNKVIANSWNHLLATWDLKSNANCVIYLNGVNSTNLRTVNALSNMNYSGNAVYVSGNSGFVGCLSEIWFSNTYVDISNSNIRTKFVGANGDLLPANLTNLEYHSSVYLRGNTLFANTNSGLGGNFNFARNIIACDNSPSDI